MVAVNAHRLSAWLVAGIPLLYAACGGEGLTLPSEGEPAHITVVRGDGQNGRVGTQLGQPLVVKVTDTQDRPVEGATVNFTFDGDAAGSSTTPPSATTDVNGEASAIITLGTRVGPVTGHATVPVPEGTVPVSTPFTAMAVPETANGIAPISGDGQRGPVGTTLPLPLVVRVTDNFGNPIPNITVDWTVTGGGEVSQSSTPTDADGRASVERTLGGTAGQQTTLATAGDLAGSPVTFTHTATAGAAARIIKESGDNQNGPAGTELQNPLVVQVLDEANNPVVGRAVTWVVGNGGGSVSPQNSNTDGEGRASTRWTLGSSGNNTVNAVVSGLAPAMFRATATAGGPSASRSRVSVDDESIPVGTTATITVRVRDASGNAVGGVSVSVSSSGTGNEITPASATSGDDGVATFSFRSTVAENKTITVVAGGVTLGEKPVITVFKLGTTTEITDVDPEPSTAGQEITVTFRVTEEGSGTPTGTVTIFSLQEAGGCTVPVSQGSCVFALNQAGTHRLGATYSGDSQFEDSSDPDGREHVVLPGTSTNQAPVAQPDAYTTQPGGGLTEAAPGVLANDSDDGGPNNLSAVLGVGPANGSLVLNSNGSFTYQATTPGATSDSFTYRANDAQGMESDLVTVSITIQ
jgi:hypothetical protein